MFQWFSKLFRKPALPSVAAIEWPVGIESAPVRIVAGGLTAVAPAYYSGWPGDCPGCDLDAKRIFAVATISGAQGIRAENVQCTKQGAINAVRRAAKGMKPDDLLIIYYSGHGGQTPDVNGDEPDGLDETLCLWDGQLSDDVIAEMLCELPTYARVFFMTDCCNSRSLARSVPPVVSAMESASASFRCQVVHFAGCDDGKSSFGGCDGGVFTNAFLASLKPGITYRQMANEISAKMPKNQPAFFTGYNTTDDFWNREIFK